VLELDPPPSDPGPPSRGAAVLRGPEGVERVAGGWRVWLSFVGVAVRLGFGRSLSRRPSHNPDREQEQAGHDGVGRAHGRCTGMIRLTVGSSTGRSYRLALPGQDAKGLLQRGVGGTAVGAPTPSRPERGPLRIAEVVIDAIHPTLAPASGSRPATPGHHRHPSAGTPACGSSSPRRKEMTISLVMADPGFRSHRPCCGPAALANEAGVAGPSLTLRSSWCLHSQASRTSSSPAVPLPCHSQRSWLVPSGQSRTTPQRPRPAPLPTVAGDQAGRSGLTSR